MALLFGDPAPSFHAPGVTNPDFAFDTVAGRYLLLAFVTSDRVDAALETIGVHRNAFNDEHAAAFIIVMDDDPDRAGRQDDTPGIRYLFDPARKVAGLYQLAEQERWILLDPALHVLATVNADQAAIVVERITQLPPPRRHGGFEALAPVLVTPRIFEPAFCQTLIELYRTKGGEPSGFMREVDGVTRLLNDAKHKKRSDCLIEDEQLQKQVKARLMRRLVPQIHKAFNYRPTRIERYLVARYDAESGGYFRAHRDNTTKGTAHRRFAVSINLNDDYDGGDLRFPEFGDRTYRPPPGGACVFSCSVLHEATSVTRGERFAFLPFLYDEQAAVIRERNLKFLDPELAKPAVAPTAADKGAEADIDA